MFRWARFAALGDVFAAYGETGDWLQAVRDVVGTDPPSGIAVVRVRDGGITVHCGPPRPVVAGVPMPLDVVVDADREVAAVVAGDAFTVAAGGAGVATVDVDGPPDGDVDGEPVSLAAAVSPTAGRPAAAAGAALRAVVGHRRHRRRVVPRRRAAQVGRPRSAVLPRRRRHAHGARPPRSPSRARADWSSTSSSGRSPGRHWSRSSRRGASTRPRTAGTAATCTST